MAQSFNWVSMLPSNLQTRNSPSIAERQTPETGGSLGALATPGAFGLASAMLPKKKAMKVEEIPAKTQFPGAKRMRLVYGPYVLKAANVSSSRVHSKLLD